MQLTFKGIYSFVVSDAQTINIDTGVASASQPISLLLPSQSECAGVGAIVDFLIKRSHALILLAQVWCPADKLHSRASLLATIKAGRAEF
jgi:hypothetical protein